MILEIHLELNSEVPRFAGKLPSCAKCHSAMELCKDSHQPFSRVSCLSTSAGRRILLGAWPKGCSELFCLDTFAQPSMSMARPTRARHGRRTVHSRIFVILALGGSEAGDGGKCNTSPVLDASDPSLLSSHRRRLALAGISSPNAIRRCWGKRHYHKSCTVRRRWSCP